jgi:AcrR family transcriptional regulator
VPTNNAAVALSPKIRRRQGRTRQRILDESARRFIENGFENVSVEEIIEAAEIARSSFYRFFANREEVLTSIVRPVFEQGLVELTAIDTDDPQEIMSRILGIFVTLWQKSPDALRVSTRVGGVHFDLFQDVHWEFRNQLAELLDAVEPSGIFLNGSAEASGRLLARTAVHVLEVYSGEPDFEQLFYRSMTGLLLNTTSRSAGD